MPRMAAMGIERVAMGRSELTREGKAEEGAGEEWERE